jgi:hypothetical protein
MQLQCVNRLVVTKRVRALSRALYSERGHSVRLSAKREQSLNGNKNPTERAALAGGQDVRAPG